MAAPALADVLLRHHIALQRLSASQVAKVDKFLDQITAEIKRRLSGQDLTELAKSRLERMLKRLDSYLADTLGTYRGEVTSDLMAIANHEADYSTKALNVSVQPDFAAPTPLQIKTAVLDSPLLVKGVDGGKLLKSFLVDWTRAERSRISGAIRLGVAMGQTNAQIVQGIRGTAAAGYQNGIIAITKRNADKVVHTAVQHVASVARQAVFDANDDVVTGVRWLATLDSRTCIQCGSLDLIEFPIDSGPRPPAHIFCRCATIPVLSADLAPLQKGGSRPSVGDDGAEPVKASTNYFSWLTTQPASFQDFAIGPSRGALLRNGGLSASRFAQMQLDKRFLPLSLAEAQKIEPLAFEQAGVDT